MDQTFTRDLNRKSSGTKGDVAIEYAELIRALWSGQFRSIAPSDFKRVIGRYNKFNVSLTLPVIVKSTINTLKCQIIILLVMLYNVADILGIMRTFEVSISKMRTSYYRT